MNGDEKSLFPSFYNLRVIVTHLNFKFARFSTTESNNLFACEKRWAYKINADNFPVARQAIDESECDSSN